MENFLKGRKRCLKNLEEEKEEKVFEKEKGEEDKGEEEKEENEKGEGRRERSSKEVFESFTPWGVFEDLGNLTIYKPRVRFFILYN
ncbi:hypothetical protein GBA52_014675 [Prunus armeniaca]|nr:hypothetical protein GBA52_014675 [Prunus armeniaca]